MLAFQSSSVGLTFLAILPALFLYFKTKIKHSLLILGLFYFGASYFASTSKDLFYITVALELSAISALFLINSKFSRNSAVSYGVFNFFSGAVLLAAIAQNSGIEFKDWHIFGKMMFCTGLLVHCGAFPFCDFIANAYSKCNAINSVFLQICSTKAVIVVLYNLFSGTQELLYFGILTIIYAFFRVFYQKSARELVAYNTIGQIGLLLIALSFGADVLSYCVASILYQTLMYIIVYELEKLKKAKEQDVSFKFLNFIAIASLIFASGLPFTFSFGAKSFMLQNSSFADYYTFLVASFLFVTLVPMQLLHKIYINKSNFKCKKTCKRKKIVACIISAASFYPVYFDHYHESHVFTQVILFVIVAGLCFYFKDMLYKQRQIFSFAKLFSCKDCISKKVFYLFNQFFDYVYKTGQSLLGYNFVLNFKVDNQKALIEISCIMAILGITALSLSVLFF